MCQRSTFCYFGHTIPTHHLHRIDTDQDAKMPPSWTLAIGCDSAGVEYKQALKADLEKDPRVTKIVDVGVSKDGGDLERAYPHVGVAAARKVAKGEVQRALLICGTGGSIHYSPRLKTPLGVSSCGLRPEVSARPPLSLVWETAIPVNDPSTSFKESIS